MFISKQVTLVVRLMFILSILITPLGVGLAEDTEPEGPVDDTVFPESISLHISDDAKEGLCSQIKLTGMTDIITYSAPDSSHTSKSRDNNNPSYPCDIDQIGARGRIWYNNVLKDDTTMLLEDNSADMIAITSATGGGCLYDYIYARGNHKFVIGSTTWKPTTDKSC